MNNETNQRRELLETLLNTTTHLNEQFTLFYQPQYELNFGKLRGFEALLRWNQPDLGLILPAEFIPIAERSLAIIPLGEWVLRQACEMLQRIAPSPSTLTLSVNISGVQLLDEQFPIQVATILKVTGVEPSRIELELTENLLVNSTHNVERQLQKLQDIGVRLVLDDFGTSYHSMKELHKLPFDLIKIDKHFIHDIGHVPEQEMTRRMIEFIKQHHYGVVAEGLETYEQLVYLKQCQCDYAQGYLFRHPMPEAKLSSLIESVS